MFCYVTLNINIADYIRESFFCHQKVNTSARGAETRSYSHFTYVCMYYNVAILPDDWLISLKVLV